jgi:hypothetical protein
MRLNDALDYIYDKVDELAKHFDQDNVEIASTLNSAAGVISYGGNDTRGKHPEFKKHSESIHRVCDDIETSVHQMEIHTLGIHRRLHGANASIDAKLVKLIEHAKQGYLDFDEYEDTVE